MRSQASETAYAEFVTARQTELRRLAVALHGDWELADEVLHRALVRLYVAWPRLQRDGGEESFVRRLIVRAAVRDRPPCSASAAPRPVLTVLRSLAPAERKTVVLRHWLGQSVEETADDLGISASRVRGHEERALAALQGAFAREGR